MSRANLSKKHKVFTYGTLRPAQTAATHKLAGYIMYDYGRFPYITQTEDACDIVVGNVLEVTDKQLQGLDHIEGVEQGLFRRDEVYVYPIESDWNLEDEVEALVYVAGTIIPPVIQSGDWYNR